MTDRPLRVVVTCGERAVCHDVDARLPAGELARVMALYLHPLATPSARPLLRTVGGPVPLDPALPLGAQVQTEAEIDLQPTRP